MTEKSTSDAQIRRRWINLGEFVAVAGLIISALALWNSWSNGKDEERPRTTTLVERARAIPLALRGQVEDDGKTVLLAPVEAAHALDTATLRANGKSSDVGSDGRLSANDVESLLGKPAKDEKAGTLPVTITARYVEAGEDRTVTGRYRIRYSWHGGGLFGGRELRLTGFSRG